MYYIVACNGGEVLVAHVKHSNFEFDAYESYLSKLTKGALESGLVYSWRPWDRRRAEEDLYHDARMHWCLDAKEFGEDKCSTQS